jgi:transposase
MEREYLMGKRWRVILTPEEDRTLRELSQAKKIPQRIKTRAEVVRRNARGDDVETIAGYYHWSLETVRKTLKRWQTGGLGGLWEAPGRGRPRRWQEEDMEYLEEVLRTDERTYNAKQLAEKLAKERQMNLTPGHLREVLQKRG